MGVADRAPNRREQEHTHLYSRHIDVSIRPITTGEEHVEILPDSRERVEHKITGMAGTANDGSQEFQRELRGEIGNSLRAILDEPRDAPDE